jgi:hypothetical protein
VIDYSDKCTCLFKVSELSLEKPNQYCHTHTPERYEICFRIPSVFYSAGSLLMVSPHVYSVFRLRKYIDRCHVGLQPKDAGRKHS